MREAFEVPLRSEHCVLTASVDGAVGFSLNDGVACCDAADAAPAGFDSVGASRVLLSGQQMVAQLAAATATANSPSPADNTGSSSSNSSASDTTVDTLDELDEAESSMDEADSGITAAADDDNVAAGSSSGSRQQRHAAGVASFAAECCQQLQKPGLLGALVAAAYPDRIAQAKPGSGAKATYSLSNGEHWLALLLRTALSHVTSHCRRHDTVVLVLV